MLCGILGAEMADEELLREQIAYYRAVAAEYEDHALDAPGEPELFLALDAFRPTGSVLELACGTGLWTQRLLRHATHITAVDAAPEMLAIAESRVRDDRVRFVQADLFNWTPEPSRYDVVFFALWLSHVPLHRLASFWSMVNDCLRPSGRVFLIDDGYRSPDEMIEGESSTIHRRLNDGRSYRVVKVPHRPRELQDRLVSLGWQVAVTPTSGPFFWGAGGRTSEQGAHGDG
jgi:demethylmenaquinone methyltransferase/2-methoxy-6-polyprenyl-1,4-benzoquinol methylase